jgi:hypothetical protein
VCGDGEVGGLAGASGREVELNMLVYQWMYGGKLWAQSTGREARH